MNDSFGDDSLTSDLTAKGEVEADDWLTTPCLPEMDCAWEDFEQTFHTPSYGGHYFPYATELTPWPATSVTFDDVTAEDSLVFSPLELTPPPKFPLKTAVSELLQRGRQNDFISSGSSVSNSSRETSKDARSDDEVRYCCSECAQVFPLSCELEDHARVTRHKAYACPEPGCDRGYHRRDVYVRHSNSHRDTPLHICKICDDPQQLKSFKRKDHLRQHIRAMHPECSFLDASGKTETTLSTANSPVSLSRSCSSPGSQPWPAGKEGPQYGIVHDASTCEPGGTW
jgi:hypothetical protein